MESKEYVPYDYKAFPTYKGDTMNSKENKACEAFEKATGVRPMGAGPSLSIFPTGEGTFDVWWRVDNPEDPERPIEHSGKINLITGVCSIEGDNQ